MSKKTPKKSLAQSDGARAERSAMLRAVRRRLKHAVGAYGDGLYDLLEFVLARKARYERKRR